jgi:NADH dehydrogenase FAD-containing subunit
MAGFNARTKSFNEHQYEYLLTSNIKSFKYLANPFPSNFEVTKAKYSKDRITKIDPSKNELTTDKGEKYHYKSLVLNTGNVFY